MTPSDHLQRIIDKTYKETQRQVSLPVRKKIWGEFIVELGNKTCFSRQITNLMRNQELKVQEKKISNKKNIWNIFLTFILK